MAKTVNTDGCPEIEEHYPEPETPASILQGAMFWSPAALAGDAEAAILDEQVEDYL